jgi:hypothetical protein
MDLLKKSARARMGRASAHGGGFVAPRLHAKGGKFSGWFTMTG